MASFSSKPNTRSISLPTRSHPTAAKIQEQLSKIRALEGIAATSTAETISNNLSTLGEVYKGFDEVLNLPSLHQHREDKWFNALLDGSVRFLDICGIIRDILCHFKEHVRSLQSSLRRRKGNLAIEALINKYISLRKKMGKESKRLLVGSIMSKHMDQKVQIAEHVDSQVLCVIRVAREVSAISISIFDSNLVHLSIPFSCKPNIRRKWGLVSRLMQRARVTCEDQQGKTSEIVEVDNAFCSLFKSSSSDQVEYIKILQRKLQILEGSIEEIENFLEGMFGCLTKSRTSLLNLISLYLIGLMFYI